MVAVDTSAKRVKYSMKVTSDLMNGGVQLTESVWTPNAVDAVIVRQSGWIPERLSFRVMLNRRHGAYGLSITRLEIDNLDKPVTSIMLRNLATELRGLCVEAMGRASMKMADPTTVLMDGAQPISEVSGRMLEDALRRAVRKPTSSKAAREDELLDMWESKYRPKGIRQKQMAAEVGLEFGALRSYLTNARKRRGN